MIDTKPFVNLSKDQHKTYLYPILKLYNSNYDIPDEIASLIVQ